MNKRIEFIDVTKGILILCLLYGHMWVFSNMNGNMDSIMLTGFRTMVFYNSFFMQAFFIITGFCSSFNIKFRTFLWKNIKTLILPALILSAISYVYSGCILGFKNNILEFICSYLNWLTIGSPWFIASMFWGKIIYWFLCRLDPIWQIIFIIFLYIFGLSLNKYGVCNIQWHQHTLLMLPYLFLGHFIKPRFDVIKPYIKYIGIIGGISILLQTLSHIYFNTFIPTHDFVINISYKTIPLHFVNVISGTSFVIFISSQINLNFLKKIGKGTLIIYLLNESIFKILISFFTDVYNPESGWICLLYYSLLYLSITLIFFILINFIYNKSYLKWIVGKW